MSFLDISGRRNPVPFQLLLVFSVSLVGMILFRDARLPIDGCNYALAVQRLAEGDHWDIFRWSHALHTPALSLCYQLFGNPARVDFLTFYQMLDIVLGSASLCLLFLLVLRTGGNSITAVASCLFALSSWVFWIESVTADEKMMGFFFVLIFLNQLLRFLDSEPDRSRLSIPLQAVVLAVILALALLLHASAVLLVPVSILLTVRKRAFRLGILTAMITVGLVVISYAVIIQLLGISGWEEVSAYFSSGISSYSVAATRVSGAAWARGVLQGITKLNWAVFSEDGMKLGLIFAGLNAVFLAGLVATMWQHRRNRNLLGFAILFFTAAAFGMTYSPESPDSYFLMIIPATVFFGAALRTPRFRFLWLGFLVVLVMNNGNHVLRFSEFRDNGADQKYLEAIAGQISPGSVLVVLDPAAGMNNGTQTILPVHSYINPQLEYVPYSEFLAEPMADGFLSLARRGELFVEGLCFEDFNSRHQADIRGAPGFEEISRFYDLEPVVRFGEYSTLYHRNYKPVFRVLPGPNT